MTPKEQAVEKALHAIITKHLDMGTKLHVPFIREEDCKQTLSALYDTALQHGAEMERERCVKIARVRAERERADGESSASFVCRIDEADKIEAAIKKGQ